MIIKHEEIKRSGDFFLTLGKVGRFPGCDKITSFRIDCGFEIDAIDISEYRGPTNIFGAPVSSDKESIAKLCQQVLNLI